MEGLEFHDTGDGITYEIWKDVKTGRKYIVPINIERLFNEKYPL